MPENNSSQNTEVKSMNQAFKNVLNKTIYRECYLASENFEDILKRNPELAASHEKSTVEFEKVLEKLKEVIPEEYKDLPEKLDSLSAAIMVDEDKLMFKEGVILGLTDLKFLNEIGPDIAYI